MLLFGPCAGLVLPVNGRLTDRLVAAVIKP